jgi:class 3 adenylate cyclase/tetratricopeptide (TPR) repeat protein
MQCAACGALSPQGKRFCGECGAALSLTCSSCGAAIETGKRFCGDCGNPLSSEPTPAIPRQVEASLAAPLAERRVCSVLFCDLVGFTSLSESRDPEEVRELLSRYFDTARTVIGRYGGIVEKFIGDAVMAVWGAPTAAEGDSERAVRAALDLVQAVDELGAEVGATSLSARAGVVTGEVAVTIGAVGQGMVAGDAVNTAARVQAAAEPGAVLVDDGTWRVARGSITFTDAGEHNLKGKSEPMTLWQAGHVVSGTGGKQRIDGLEAPLVGRDAELRLIKDLFHASADRRSARLVSVIGPAGVGKSRLGWEFYKYIDGLVTMVRWHRGRCLSYGDGVAFWAFAEMVRQRLGIAEDDATDVATTKLDDRLAELIADPATREYVRPRIARLLGVEDDESGLLSRDELFAGWRTFIEQMAVTEPVVLVVEDLQHADTGMLDFIEHLLDWSRDVPIFVLTLARPELEDRRPGWASGRRNGTSLSLEPLDDAAMDAMIEGLVAGMPAEGKAAVAAQAQGIPLYAVETVRMLIDRDAVQPIDGVYRLVGDVGQLAVPDTLQSLLAARLDALPPDARVLVADAAVLGGTFPVEAMSAVSTLPETEVQRLLDELVHREVLMVRADALSPERGQYGFVQTMFRQVAYDTLSRRERKARHLAVADHLGRTFADEGEEIAEVIAQHLLDALAAVPDDDDIGELRQRAADELVRAADRALRTGAPAVAVRTLRTAADLRLDGTSTEAALAAASLLERAGRSAIVASDFTDAGDSFSRAAELYAEHGQHRLAARSKIGLGRSLRRVGRHEDARRVLRDSLEVLKEEPDADTVATLEQLATLESFAANSDEAERFIAEALRLAQALGLPLAVFAELFTGQGIVSDSLDRHVEAVAAYQEAARLSDLLGNAHQKGMAQLNLSDSLLAQGLWSASVEAARLSIATLSRIGSGSQEFATGNLMQALLFGGQWDEVAEVIETKQADGEIQDPYFAWCAVMLHAFRGQTAEVPPLLELVSTLAGSEDHQDRSTMATTECVIAANQGDTRLAAEHARTAIAEGEQIGAASEGIRWCWPIAADCALANDDLEEVDRLLAWADGHPDGHLHPIVRADRLRVRARLHASRGDAAANTEFTAAIEALRALGSPYHLAVGLSDYARHLEAFGSRDEAELLTAEAQVIAEQLGARPLLVRIAARSDDEVRATSN